MIRLNIYIHTLGGGGAEKALINMVNNLNHEKFKITVTTIIDTGEYKKYLSDAINYSSVIKIPKFIVNRFTNAEGTLKKSKQNAKAINIYSFFWKYLSWTLKPIGWIQNRNSDIIISYLEGPTHIFVSQIPNKTRKISWIHVDLSVEKKSELFFKNLEANRKSYEKYDEVVTVSVDIKNSLKNYIGIKNVGKINTLYNVYDELEIKELSRQKLKIGTNSKIKIVSVGRLSHQKGYDRLIRAAQECKKITNNFELKIIGDGELFEEFQSYITENNLSDCVELLGYKENPYPYIAEADLFFSSSRTEGYSTVVVEALILSKAIIATDCSGMAEILNDGKYGEIIENNQKNISKYFLKAVEDVEFLENLKRKSSIASEKYSLKNSITQIEEFLLK